MSIIADIYAKLFAPAFHEHATSGSNSKGYYRKWDSGELEMWGTASISKITNNDSYNNPATINFPINFVDTTYFFDFIPVGLPYDKGTRSYHFITGKTTSKVNISDHDIDILSDAITSGSTNTITVDWHAIGKWK